MKKKKRKLRETPPIPTLQGLITLNSQNRRPCHLLRSRGPAANRRLTAQPAIPEPAVLASPGSSFKMQTLSFPPRPPESESAF